MVPPRVPLLSIVVPARDAAATLPACLEAAMRAADGRAEVVVVDDGSTDGTGEAARRAGACVVRHETALGPARARNAGARAAAAPILLFVDADILLAPDAVIRVLDAFALDVTLAAVFGSYDDDPAARTLVSDYRNLLHHFVHQSSSEESGSFWAGCGAVRAEVFRQVGGFDERYRRPSIEDIEFGARLARAGHRIRLDKGLTGRHLKAWTLASLVVADVRDRAYPWAMLILQEGQAPLDLNLQFRHRASAALVWIGAASAAGLFAAAARGWPARAETPLALASVSAAAGVIACNLDFYRFLIARRGLVFTTGAVLLHALYYAYASATFAWCWARHHTVGSPRVGEHVV